jgi:hypothetical protein
MSNSAIRGEDEAVLESIRRLVSATPHAEVARERPSDPEQNDKLLLTPALRIEEPEEPVFHGRRPSSAVDESAWSLEDRIAELEAAVGARPDEWEPDGSEDLSQETPDRFVFQHRPLPLTGREAVAEPVALRAFQPQDEVEAAEADGIDISESAALLDEDALRDIVAEIVRQELQGELGQKVTRNIRKLVRREIRRALASRDFD